MKEDIVKVVWKDITHLTKARDKEEAVNHNLIEYVNLGYLIYQDKNKIVMCASKIENFDSSVFLSDDTLRDIMIIPKGMIKSITKLKEVK